MYASKPSIVRKTLCVLLALSVVLVVQGCQPQPPLPPVQTATPIATTAPVPTPLAALSPAAVPAPDYWPTIAWKSSTPEQQGMDSAKLAAMFDAIEAKGLNLHSVLIIRNGYLVTEAYFGPYTPGIKHQVMSVTKSVSGMLIGIVANQGLIQSTSECVFSFFPSRKIANLDENKRRITLENLLTLTTGFNCTDSAGTLDQMLQGRDWVQFALDLPMAAAPGKQFWYCSPAVHLLSAVVQGATGKTEREFANESLFKPLGIPPAGPADWAGDPQGSSQGFSGLRLKTRDMARLGFLYLQGGNWDGEQVVPAAWVAASLQPHTTEESTGRGYGYLTWLYPQKGYASMMGRGGQDIHIIPSKNMVVVFTAAMDIPTHDKEVIALLDEYVVPAASSRRPLPQNPAAAARLEARIARAGGSQKVPVPALPAVARSFSGRVYAMEPNVNRWNTFSLTFKDGSAEAIILIDNAGKVPIGLDNVHRTTDVPSIGPVALRGRWEEGATFVFEADTLGSGQTWQYRISLGEDLRIEGKEQVSGAVYTMTGHLAP